jgi:serine/threonine-protein kinase
MLTGRRLFEGETVSDTVAAVLRADLDWDQLPEGTPTGVIRLLKRCLERDGRRRLRDIGEARVRLERWRENPSAIHESTTMYSSDLPPAGAARPWLNWVLGAVAAAALLMLGWNLMRDRSQPARMLSFAIDVPGEESINPYSRNNVLLSNDGDTMGWITREGIYVRSLDDRESRLLEGTDNAQAAAFSPDGNWVGFVSRNRLWRISIAGGAPFDICETAAVRGLAWIDDETLVFPTGITTGLSAVSITDGVLRELTTTDPDRNERSHRWPTPVPGRRAVLFECQYLGRDYDQSDIQMIDLDGGERRTIHRGGAAPTATNDGHLLFVRGSTLYAMAFDLAAIQAVGLPVPVLTDLASSVGNQEDDDGSAQYAVDRHGSLLYLDTGGELAERSRLILLDLVTGDTEEIADLDLYRDLLMSPDGSLLALSRGPYGDEELYVHDLTSGNETLLTRRRSVEYLGAWSPDSRVLYWTQSSDDGARFEVWRRPVDGATPAEHVSDMPDGRGAWVSDISPDGRTLLVTVWSSVDLNNIYSLDLTKEGAELEPFIVGPERSWGAKFVGRSDYVIYEEDIAGQSHNLFLRRFPDTGAVWSFVGPPEGYRATWWHGPLGGVVAFDGSEFSLLPLEIDDEGPTLSRPQRHRFTGDDHDLDEVWAASIAGDRPYLACLVLEDEGAIRPGSGPSLVYVSGWGRELAEKVAAAR